MGVNGQQRVERLERLLQPSRGRLTLCVCRIGERRCPKVADLHVRLQVVPDAIWPSEGEYR